MLIKIGYTCSKSNDILQSEVCQVQRGTYIYLRGQFFYSLDNLNGVQVWREVRLTRSTGMAEGTKDWGCWYLVLTSFNDYKVGDAITYANSLRNKQKLGVLWHSHYPQFHHPWGREYWGAVWIFKVKWWYIWSFA